MSQRELARQIGVSVQAVSQWELGRTTPNLGRLAAVANRLGVPLSSLYGREFSSGTFPLRDGAVPLVNFEASYFFGLTATKEFIFPATDPAITPFAKISGRGFAVSVDEALAAGPFEIGDLLIFDNFIADLREGDCVIALPFQSQPVQPVLRKYKPGINDTFTLEALEPGQQVYKFGPEDLPIIIIIAKLTELRRLRDPVTISIK